MRSGLLWGAILSVSALFSCRSDSEKNSEQTLPATQKPLSTADSLALLELNRFNQIANAADAQGIIGVFNIPEMLAMVVMDSARMQEVAEKRAQAFADIESDVALTGAQTEGSPGSIYYNNDPYNFKFECLMLIRDFPARNPLKSKVVVLEASPMVVYNHRGPYSRLSSSYGKIQQYCDSMKLVQSGPMREFYLVSPIQNNDSMSWLTRIMLPVSRLK